MNIPSKYSSHIFLLSCTVRYVWTSFGILERHGKRQGWTGCKETCGWHDCRTRTLAELSAGWQQQDITIQFPVQAFCKEDKNGKGVISTLLLHDVHILAQCSHEKDDSRLLLHVSHMLADGPYGIPDDTMNIMDRFVIPLFDRTSTCTKVDHARRKLFPRKINGAANSWTLLRDLC